MYTYCTVYRTDVYVTQRCSKLLSWRHAPGFDTRRIFFPAPAERAKNNKPISTFFQALYRRIMLKKAFEMF